MKAKDQLEFVHEILNHPELQQDESARKWLEDKDNKKLYDQCRLYIEAGFRKDKRFFIDSKVAFKDFKKRINRQYRRKILFRSSVAASVIIIISLFGIWRYNEFLSKEEYTPNIYSHIMPHPLTPGKAYALLITESGKTIVLDGLKKEKIQIEKDIAITYDSLQQMHYMLSEEAIHYHVLQVPKGGEYKLALSDGTIVWLNSESELRYPTVFKDSVREVELKGEGYFSVTHNTEIPFVVSASGIKTKVYGTEFNVQSYSKENINITLVKGLVSVTNKKVGKEYMLKPGENAHFEGEQPTISQIDVRRFTSWKEGSFYYKNERLENIMNDLQRWYNFKTVYTREKLKDLRFELWLDRDSDINTVIELLTATNKIQMNVNEQEIIISDM